jgi:hypothetical protein
MAGVAGLLSAPVAPGCVQLQQACTSGWHAAAVLVWLVLYFCKRQLPLGGQVTWAVPLKKADAGWQQLH